MCRKGGSQKARGRANPPSRGDGLHSCPRPLNPTVPVSGLALPVSSSPFLARGLFVVIPPPTLLIPGPVFACLAAKDKLQAFRRLLFRYPNRALPKGKNNLSYVLLSRLFFSFIVHFDEATQCTCTHKNSGLKGT